MKLVRAHDVGQICTMYEKPGRYSHLICILSLQSLAVFNFSPYKYGYHQRTYSKMYYKIYKYLNNAVCTLWLKVRNFVNGNTKYLLLNLTKTIDMTFSVYLLRIAEHCFMYTYVVKNLTSQLCGNKCHSIFYQSIKLPKMPQVVGSLNCKRYQQKHPHIISANDVSKPYLNTHIGTSESFRFVARGVI